MVLNKKSQTVFVGVMIAIMVFITAIVLINPLKDVITTGRNVDNLDCGNESITVGTRATCILVDLWLFYFVGTTIAGGIAFITAKRIKREL